MASTGGAYQDELTSIGIDSNNNVFVAGAFGPGARLGNFQLNVTGLMRGPVVARITNPAIGTARPLILA